MSNLYELERGLMEAISIAENQKQILDDHIEQNEPKETNTNNNNNNNNNNQDNSKSRHRKRSNESRRESRKGVNETISTLQLGIKRRQMFLDQNEIVIGMF
jgi:hypothetical protein